VLASLSLPAPQMMAPSAVAAASTASRHAARSAAPVATRAHGQGRGAATPAALLATPGDQRRERGDVRVQQECTGARRTAEFVRRDRQAVRAKPCEVHVHPSRRLHRVHVQQRAVPAAQRGGCGHRLDSPGLVVRQHQADQGARLDRQQPGKACQIGDSVAVHRQGGRARGSRTHGIMFRGTDDDLPAGPESVDRQDVCFGAA
jgi:hypothetical protein